MKTSFLSILLSTILISCTDTKSDRVTDFIPGMYIRAFVDSINETTNTVGIDTLEIKKFTEAGSDLYEIERRTKFQRTVDGEKKSAEYKVETWKGIYDKEKKIIQETSKGKIISFVPEKNILLVNTAEYKKLK